MCLRAKQFYNGQDNLDCQVHCISKHTHLKPIISSVYHPWLQEGWITYTTPILNYQVHYNFHPNMKSYLNYRRAKKNTAASTAWEGKRILLLRQLILFCSEECLQVWLWPWFILTIANVLNLVWKKRPICQFMNHSFIALKSCNFWTDQANRISSLLVAWVWLYWKVFTFMNKLKQISRYILFFCYSICSHICQVSASSYMNSK